MKLPLWYKNQEGKYVAFPSELIGKFTTFKDGKHGMACKDLGYAPWLREPFKTLFIYDPSGDRYVLRKEVPRWQQWWWVLRTILREMSMGDP